MIKSFAIYKSTMNFLMLLSLSIFLVACGNREVEKQVELPAKTLYENAKALEDDGDYKNAIKGYQEVERQHPQSDYAKIAMADSVFLAYANLKYVDAILFAENFISYNTNHKLAAKVTYIRALSYYEQISDIGRDQGNTTKALQSLNDIILSYPNSDYALNAKYKIHLARDNLAGKELSVGRFYQKNGDYLAAITRFNRVIKLYSETSQAPEALARIVETNLALGLYNRAYETGVILGHNHKNNKWYKYSYDLLQKYKKK